MPIFAIALLALAAPASAVFIETPLRLAASDTEVDVGDKVAFHAEPANKSAAEDLAGAEVVVRWSRYDPNGTPEQPRVLRDGMRLDEEARLAFEWTVPSDADDRNVFITIERGDEILAQAYLLVGDAEPLMMAMNGPAGDEEGTPRIDDERKQEAASVPAPGVAFLLGALAVGLVVLRRRA